MKTVIKILEAKNWNPESISEVKTKLQTFSGIVVIKKHEILFSDSSKWKTSINNAISIAQKKYPGAIILTV